MARSEGGDDGGMWKEVADEVRRDAERLFKLIGEANAILSDPQKVRNKPCCVSGHNPSNIVSSAVLCVVQDAVIPVLWFAVKYSVTIPSILISQML